MSQERPYDRVRKLQRTLYSASKANSNRRFGILHDKICSSYVLQEAWRRVKSNKGSMGADGIKMVHIVEEIGVDNFLMELQQELQGDSYKAFVIKRVYIPKGDHDTRPLGIPTIKDRVAQMAVKLVIEPLFDADFCDCSYGFRPKKSNQQAVNEVHKICNRNKWIVDVDLKSYFDTISHDKLMELIRKRVGDKRVLALIRQWLKADILEDGQLWSPEEGTPQGGVLSPLLSNIFLHEIDKLWATNKSVKIVRFADDMVLLCVSDRQAQFVLDKLAEQLTELRLSLNEEKTKIRHVRDSFDFLGFTFKEAYSVKHKRMVRIKFPCLKSMKKIRQNIKSCLKMTPLGTDIRDAIKLVNTKLRGWSQYFRIGNAYKQALEISNYACFQLRLFWRRRKQLKQFNGYRIWPNAFFYTKGLYYVPNFL